MVTIARKIVDDVSIVLCGEAGQGIQTVERLLTRILRFAGFHVYGTKEYMSRVRGGSNATEIRISSEQTAAYVARIDILIPLDKDAIPHLADRITDSTIIVGEKDKLQTGRAIIDVPFTKIATELGGAIYANTIAVGMILGLLGIEPETLDTYLASFFERKSQDIIDRNKAAGKRGYDIGKDMAGPGKIEVTIRRHPEIKNDIIMSGADLLSMGAIAGGCNFIAAYPMTPSTDIITFLSQHAAEFGIIAEQAEDEISAVNMAIGAWYAGGRAMTATAGGGFALMIEGVSLAGMFESPLVVSVGMRPAPATGLPTRTEQGDLNHVLYSGHGEFPRIILAPGNLEQTYALAARAFDLADKFQSPVFILSDQYLMDSYYNMPAPVTEMKIEHHTVKTAKEYRRYAFTDDGLSPRGVPGYGDGLVCCDSDEHDEEGHITESMAVRTKMVDKRLKKLELIKKEIVPPELLGAAEYKTLIVAWGSNYGAIKEALGILKRDDVAFLHYSQVYPLHPSTLAYLKKAKKTILIENNATAQFGQLVKLGTGMDFDHKILKYDGMPFSVEDIVMHLNVLLGKGGRKAAVKQKLAPVGR
jgi:2-oxoglutarate ferredoxin oxidoreductase subunit alpha